MRRDGGLAQLGERLPCKQEVSGSIPLISTTYFLLKKKVSKENFKQKGFLERLDSRTEPKKRANSSAG